MKVLQINIFGNLSTGRIAVDLYRTLREAGHDGLVAFARNDIDQDVPHTKIGNTMSVYMDGVMTRLTDKAGHYSRSATRRLIQQIKEYNPDIIHLHNLHGYYINVPMLFEYLRMCGKPVIWTLHDCWAFTGHCCYYSMVGCEKWKTHCEHCPQKLVYPKSLYVDRSYKNYDEKRTLFTSLPNLHLVCVSNWLASEVQQSFLKDLPCTVIHNGIDTNVFKPTEGTFRERYGLVGKKIILAVSTSWSSKRKGLNDVLRLSDMSKGEYQVVIVGVTEKEKREIGGRAIAIARTDSPQELAAIYSAADLFFNASVEETFGLPTVEAMACGTPVVVYNATAVPEVVKNGTGYVVDVNDIEAVYRIIQSDFLGDMHTCVQMAQLFSKPKIYSKYINLYQNILQVR